jgi:uncharacterized membrane protein
MSNFLKTPLYRFWLIVNCVMGVFYVFVVPPFQTPDEFNHFYKISHILDGHFYPEIDTPTVSLGGYVPQSVIDIEQPYIKFVWHEDIKSNFDTLKAVLNTPLSKSNKTFASFPNTARYAPIAYSPPLIGCGIAWFLNLNPAYATYMGRLANLAFWLICMTAFFRISPVFHHILAFITLLPGTIAIQSTLSADVFTNGCLFIIIGLFLKFRFTEKPISRLELGSFWVLTLLTTWAKMVYFPIVLTLLLVPKERFGGLTSKITNLSIGLFINLLVVAWWSSEVNLMIYPFGDIQKNTYHDLHEAEDPPKTYLNVNPELQKQRILSAPFSFLANFVANSFGLYSYNNKSYISTVGWEGLAVNRMIHTLLIVSLLLFIAIQKSIFATWERWALVVIGHGMCCAFLLSQHLHWDEVGPNIAITYIGKYYIPIYPFLMFALMGILYRYQDSLKKLRLEKLYPILIVIAFLNMIYITIDRF